MRSHIRGRSRETGLSSSLEKEAVTPPAVSRSKAAPLGRALQRWPTLQPARISSR
jgi:hypothetical protein